MKRWGAALVMLSLLLVGALAVEKPTISDWLGARFMFDQIEIDKEELRMQSVIDYIEDNELGDTEELEDIASRFSDAAADLEAYARKNDPTEIGYNETRDELFLIVDDFRTEARLVVTDEEERERIRGYVNLQIVDKVDKYADMLVEAKDNLKDVFLNSYDWSVQEQDRILTELETAGIDVSDLREKHDELSAKRGEVVAAFDSWETFESYARGLQLEIQELFTEIGERAQDYWATKVISEAEKGIQKARDSINGIKANATLQGIELDFSEEEAELDELEDEIKSLKTMNITEAQIKYRNEIEPKFKSLATRIVMKIYLESVSAISAKTRAEFAKAKDKAEKEGVTLDLSELEAELESLEEEVKALEPLIQAGDYKIAEEKFKKEIEPKYKELGKKFVVKIYLAYSDLLISRMKSQFEKVEDELAAKDIDVDLSDEYAELEKLEDEFDELGSLIDEGDFKDVEEKFKKEILPKYEKLGLKAYVAVMDAVSNKMVGDSRKALKKFRKDAEVYDLILDLSEQEKELDDFEDRLEDVKVLIRENKTAEADKKFKEVEADFGVFWKKGGAKIKIAGAEKWAEAWVKIISAAESAGLDTSSMNAKIADIKDIIEEAKTSYENEDYDEAASKLEPLESMFKELEALLPRNQESEII